MEELAVFGGKPVREKPIFYGRQYIDQEDVEAVTKVLTADVITSGPQVSDLEKHLCEYYMPVQSRSLRILTRRLIILIRHPFGS